MFVEVNVRRILELRPKIHRGKVFQQSITFQSTGFAHADESYSVKDYLCPKVKIGNTDCAVVPINYCSRKIEPHVAQRF